MRCMIMQKTVFHLIKATSSSTFTIHYFLFLLFSMTFNCLSYPHRAELLQDEDDFDENAVATVGEEDEEKDKDKEKEKDGDKDKEKLAKTTAKIGMIS